MPATVDLNPALERARRALAHLEAQAAGFGALHIPTHLQIELEEKRQEVVELEARIAQPSAGATAATTFDQREQQVSTQINVAGDYHAAPGNTYVTYIEHAEGLAIGDGAQVVPDSVVSAATSAATSTAGLRQLLARLDDVELDALCMDHFPAVYDQFGRGSRRDEKLNLLLDHCRRRPEAMQRLMTLLGDHT